MNALWFEAWWYFVFLEAFMYVEYKMADRDGYGRDEQVEARAEVPVKYLTFESHWGMWGDIFVMSPVVAYILAAHASSWSLLWFSVIFLVSALSGAGLAIPLMDDSKRVPSTLMRDGYFPLAGAMHYLYYTVALAVCAAYYFETPRAALSLKEVAIISALIVIHWSAGVLQPPLKVHGRIHWPAWAATGGVGVGVLALSVIRLTLI